MSRSFVVSRVAYLGRIAGLNQYYPGNAVVVLEGDPQPADALRAEYQQGVDAMDKAEKLDVEHKDAMKERDSIILKLGDVEAKLETAVQATFGKKALAAFKFKARKKGKKTIKVKAGAIDKAKLTREARHTMGKKQRRSVKGGNPSPANGEGSPGAAPAK